MDPFLEPGSDKWWEIYNNDQDVIYSYFVNYEARHGTCQIPNGGIWNKLSPRLKADDEFVYGSLKRYLINERNFLMEKFEDPKATLFLSFCSLPTHLRNDKEIVMKGMARNCFVEESGLFLTIPKPLRNDKDVVMTALIASRKSMQVRSTAVLDDSVIQNVSDIPYMFKDDEDVALLVLELFTSGFDWISARLKNDKDFVMAALPVSGKAVQFKSVPDIPHTFKDDEDVALLVLQLFRSGFDWVSSRLRDDQAFMTSILTRDISPPMYSCLSCASPRLQANKEFVLANIGSVGGSCIEYASADLRNDFDVAIAAVKNGSPLAYGYLSPAMRSNKRVAMAALTQRQPFLLFRSFPAILRKDIDVCIAFISSNPSAIGWMEEEMKSDRRFVMRAVSVSGMLLEDFPLFRNDVEICIAAVANSKYAFEFIADEFKASREFFEGLVLRRFDAISLAPRNMKDDHRMVCLALTNAPSSPNCDDVALAHRCFGHTFERIAKLNKKLKKKGDFLLSDILCHVDKDSSSKRPKRTTEPIDVKKWDHNHCEKMWLVKQLGPHRKWSGLSPVHLSVMEYSGLNDSNNTHKKVRKEIFLWKAVINRMVELNWTMPPNTQK